jgi:hypothetical protein
MKDNATGSVKVTYFSRCVGDGPVRETNKCVGLRVGSRVQFTGKYHVYMFKEKYLNFFTEFRCGKVELILYLYIY